jgi:uncharacterized GH25 family protein
VPAFAQTRIAVTLVALAFPASIGAHDFWILPTSFQPAAGAAVGLHLFVGEHFVGERVPRSAAQIERFFVVGPAGVRDVIGRDGMDPAGVLRADAPGTWVVGYRSRPSRVELAAPAFEQYLRDEGLEHVIAERARVGESAAPAREQFSRSVKSILTVGATSGAEAAMRPLGLTLELVPQRDPRQSNLAGLPLRLLYNGMPLANAQIVGFRQDHREAGPVEPAAKVRTDRDGRATVPSAPGRWLIKAVQMRRADAGSGVEWESIWTSLTFSVKEDPSH